MKKLLNERFQFNPNMPVLHDNGENPFNTPSMGQSKSADLNRRRETRDRTKQ